MKPSHKPNPLLALFVFLVSLLLIASITGFRIPAALASVTLPLAIGTHLPGLLSTTMPATSNSPTSGYRPISWVELVSFLAKDHTNWNQYIPGKYTCLEFATDLVANAGKQGIKAPVVTVEFAGGGPGHAFVAFETTKRGIVYVEPQADDTYPIVEVGMLLRLVGSLPVHEDCGIY
jgi:hypothetical protein